MKKSQKQLKVKGARWISFYKKSGPDKAERYTLRLKRKRRLIDLLGGKCVDCGYNAHLAALDFDHVDPKLKSVNVSTLLQNTRLAFHVIVAEAEKCVIRCANCHRIKTFPSATD